MQKLIELWKKKKKGMVISVFKGQQNCYCLKPKHYHTDNMKLNLT